MDRNEVLELLDSIILRPQMFAWQPEAVHGLVVSLVAVVLCMDSDTSLQMCFKKANDMVQEVAVDVPRHGSQLVLLCDEERYPNVRTSLEALSRHARQLVDRIRDK